MCLNALIVALNETCDGKRWYTSTKELQLASLEFCTTCRNYQTLHLTVDARTPRRLLAAADPPPRYSERLGGGRVPRLRARRVTWNMPTAAELRTPILAMMDVDCLWFGGAFSGNLETLAWLGRLKTIHMMESSFNKPIDLVEWPACLQRLEFGDLFNQPIERVEFPASLRQLIFHGSFNQPIAGALLPTSLQELDLGQAFNHPIEDIVWPPSLQKLQVGYEFDQPLQRVVFPSSLQEFTVLGSFNQPIEGVLWPDSLQRLALGYSFNRPIENVRWPTSLQEITFACCEDQGDDEVVVYADFNQSIGGSFWPASLRRLTLGNKFRQSLEGLGTWMPNLEALRLLSWDDMVQHNSLLRGIEWPKGLRHLTVLDEYCEVEVPDLDGVEIPSTIRVHRMNLCF
ncbi:unnamed protein product [Ectocarpus fasciculatus]